MKLPTLDEFIHSGDFRNAYLKHRYFSVYVRIGKRLINNVVYKSFEIANVSVKQVRKRGKGHFTEFLKEIEASLVDTDITVLYIENVFNERFQMFFHELGFDETDEQYDFCKSYHKLINK